MAVSGIYNKVKKLNYLCATMAGLVLLFKGDNDLFNFKLFTHSNHGDQSLICQHGVCDWIDSI